MGLKEFFEENKARKEVLKLDDQSLNAIVKIQGTKYDRKRKYSDKTILAMRNDYISGASISAISKKYNIPYNTVAYNVDDDFKKSFNLKRSGKHTGIDTVTTEDRAQYKRFLVKKRKIKVSGMV